MSDQQSSSRLHFLASKASLSSSTIEKIDEACEIYIGRNKRILLIAERIAQNSGVSVDEMIGGSRRPKIVRARWLAFYFARKEGYTFKRIADAFNVDHTTVWNGYNEVCKVMGND